MKIMPLLQCNPTLIYIRDLHGRWQLTFIGHYDQQGPASGTRAAKVVYGLLEYEEVGPENTARKYGFPRPSLRREGFTERASFRRS